MLQGAIYITYIYLTFLLVRHLYLERKRTSRVFDCIDIQIEVQPVQFDDMSSTVPAESSSEIRRRVIAAREIQQERFKHDTGVHCNAQMNTRLIKKYAMPEAAGLARLKDAMERLSMSARAYDRILNVERTIADLAGSDTVLDAHIGEAIAYRNLDRSSWGQTFSIP